MQTPENDPPAARALVPEAALARRWDVSIRTLQRWRHARTGPAWVSIGRSIFYRAQDIEAFELASRHEGAGK